MFSINTGKRDDKPFCFCKFHFTELNPNSTNTPVSLKMCKFQSGFEILENKCITTLLMF